MKHCKYCANTDTRLDNFGYCKKYDCFSKSGMRNELNILIRSASDIYTMPDTRGQIGTTVTNSYRHRTRKANEVMNDAIRTFGFLPIEVLQRIPTKNREKWDKNIRW